jgi:hypothetical protein
MTTHDPREALRALAALGHEPKPNDRCTARVKSVPPEKRPPGPSNPPIWCCLPIGHDGAHRCNGGGAYPSIPFRDTDEIEHRNGFETCSKCGTRWPCADAQKVITALTAQAEDVKRLVVDDAMVERAYEAFFADSNAPTPGCEKPHHFRAALTAALGAALAPYAEKEKENGR